MKNLTPSDEFSIRGGMIFLFCCGWCKGWFTYSEARRHVVIREKLGGTYAHVCSRMLMYAFAEARMLTYARVCSRMLTYAVFSY
jgi:hypothetical protein